MIRVGPLNGARDPKRRSQKSGAPTLPEAGLGRACPKAAVPECTAASTIADSRGPQALTHRHLHLGLRYPVAGSYS
eukprot:11726072-Alexandrium_andersonii.AAC.1